MFRDYETRYVIVSVAVAWLITILLAAYEIFINRSDTGLQTAVASAVGMAIATGITLLLVATWEVFMVLVRRYNARRLADAKKEGKEEGLKIANKRWQAYDQSWQDWYDNLPQEVKDQQPARPEPPREEEP